MRTPPGRVVFYPRGGGWVHGASGGFKMFGVVFAVLCMIAASTSRLLSGDSLPLYLVLPLSMVMIFVEMSRVADSRRKIEFMRLNEVQKIDSFERLTIRTHAVECALLVLWLVWLALAVPFLDELLLGAMFVATALLIRYRIHVRSS